MKNKNKLQSLKKNFQSGKITKEKFITKAMEIHKNLHDYSEIIKNIEINKISITKNELSFIVGKENIKMVIPKDESRVAPLEIINFGSYEPNESKVMDLLASDAAQIIDVGANIGYHTIRFAKKYKKSVVHSFEPMPVSYSYLKKNIVLNQLNSKINTYKIGLSDKDGIVDFFVPIRNGTNTSMINVSKKKNSKKILCKIIKLDKFCFDKNIKPNFIKCDVEGAELLVFQGAEKTIKSHSPKIFTELLRKWSKPYGYHPNDMINFFSNLGYICYGIGTKKIVKIETVNHKNKETNYVFLHSKKHLKTIQKLKKLRW